MPDVISNVQTMSLNRVDNFMDDESAEERLMAQLNNNVDNHNRNLLNLDQLSHDPMLSAASTSSHLHQQHSTVDMSSIDPIITGYGLISMHHNVNGGNTGNGSVESILHSDSDSLISDIDMMA